MQQSKAYLVEYAKLQISSYMVLQPGSGLDRSNDAPPSNSIQCHDFPSAYSYAP
jgi:hypothetical protein